MLRFTFKCPCGADFDKISDEVGDYPASHPCKCGSDARVKVIAVIKDGEYKRCDGINGCQITEETRKALNTPLGRKNMAGVKTVKDIDRVLDKIGSNYPSLKRPDRC